MTDTSQVSSVQEQDLMVLNFLEDLEEERLNFGLYETFIAEEEILYHINKQFSWNLSELRDSLARLKQNYYVLQLGESTYRSRISEIVRVLKNVKQRFRNNDFQQAPYLIQSIRVKFENRKQLSRNIDFKTTIDQLFQENRRLRLEYFDSARKAVQKGFADALNTSLEDIRVTRIQESSLLEVTKKYLHRKGQGFVITGNTGSGKTEAAVLPLLIGALQEKMAGVNGCKIILVYPRQALAKNQLERLSHYIASINQVIYKTPGVSDKFLSTGIVFGETPSTQQELISGLVKDQRVLRGKWNSIGDGYEIPYFRDGNGEPVVITNLSDGVGNLTPTDGTWEIEGFKATRQAIVQNPPDVLIITTEMLHRWLMDPQYNGFFGLPKQSGRAPLSCAPRAIVFDEIHLYDTIHGAQIGTLIRRLRYRIQQAMYAARQVTESETWEYPIVLGMSATIGNPGSFWKTLSGVPFVTEISPNPDDFESTKGREYFFFIRPETYSRGKRPSDASTAIQSIMAIAHNMCRRGGDRDTTPKFRSLIFQDSISKVKKLATDFYDAETNKHLSQLRLRRPTSTDIVTSQEFWEGEYWYFDVEDTYQYSNGRTTPGQPATQLTSRPSPVYSGTGKNVTDLLEQDIIFATTSLEVGYDDSSIQFVLQHHAPRNPASFVQKKGRAGRSLSDRPITAVTLSRSSYKDAFYYQNPHLLYDPADYRPPLNVDNYFVQSFQTLALIFDELSRLTQSNLLRAEFPNIEAHFDAVDQVLTHSGVAQQIQWAYEKVIGELYRKAHPHWQDTWNRFRDRMLQDDIRFNFKRENDLLQLCPEFPTSLFSTINLPTVRVMFSNSNTQNNWDGEDLDIAVAFSEFAPGRVTRRYGRNHELYWRSINASVVNSQSSYGSRTVKNSVAIERYKQDRIPTPGPFDPLRLQSLPDVWGTNWLKYLPINVGQVYEAKTPDRFYRIRYLELWDFGTININDPRRLETDWYGLLNRDGTIEVKYAPSGAFRDQQETRPISPDSNSYPLSFSVVKVNDDVVPVKHLALPPLFKGLVDKLNFYFGQAGAKRSILDVWEIYYGAEATIKLQSQQKDDPHAGMGQNIVKYISEHDGSPTFYGYDLKSEGVSVEYNAETLREIAKLLFDEIWSDARQKHNLQDQYFRFLIKSCSLPLQGVQHPLNRFDLRKVADILATARAETRVEGTSLDDFLNIITNRQSLETLITTIKNKYWRDHRNFADDFMESFIATFTSPQVREFLEEQIFRQIRNPGDVIDYLMDILIHSLKQSTRNLFLIEGNTRDEEVGSHSVLKVTHGHFPETSAFYVYERNQDGNGATRLAFELLDEKSSKEPAYLSSRWWDSTLSCPVGDEEDFLKAVLRSYGSELLKFQEEFFQAEPQHKPDPKRFLSNLLQGQLTQNSPFLQRLAGLLTSQLSLLGETISLVGLQIELQHLEVELAERFNRQPVPIEVAGYAATKLELHPGSYHFLSRLMEMYVNHAAELESDSDDLEDTAEPLDRFLAQVENLSLSTCVSACPACLTANCDQGHIDIMRHTISRRYLKRAHYLLTKDLTRKHGEASVDDLIQVALTNNNYVILEYQEQPDPAYSRQLKDRGFEAIMRIFDHETLKVRQVLYYKQ